MCGSKVSWQYCETLLSRKNRKVADSFYLTWQGAVQYCTHSSGGAIFPNAAKIYRCATTQCCFRILQTRKWGGIYTFPTSLSRSTSVLFLRENHILSLLFYIHLKVWDLVSLICIESVMEQNQQKRFSLWLCWFCWWVLWKLWCWQVKKSWEGQGTSYSRKTIPILSQRISNFFPWQMSEWYHNTIFEKTEGFGMSSRW